MQHQSSNTNSTNTKFHVTTAVGVPDSTTKDIRPTLSGEQRARLLCTYYDQVSAQINSDGKYDSSPLLTELLERKPVAQLTLRPPLNGLSGISGKSLLLTLQEEIFNKATWPEKIYTLSDVAERYSVSAKTVDRWRLAGHITSYPFTGATDKERKLLCVSEFHLSDFDSHFAKKKEKISSQKAIRTDEEKKVVSRFLELTRERPSLSATRISTEISKEFPFSGETIYKIAKREGLTKISADIRQSAIFDKLTPLYMKGADIKELSEKFKLPLLTTRTAIANKLFEQLANTDLAYHDHPDFSDKKKHNILLGPMPESEEIITTPKPPAGLPSYLKELYQYSVLTKEQEQHLFKKMNYQKHLASIIFERQKNLKSPNPDKLREAVKLHEDAIETRNTIIQFNLRLVISVVKPFINNTFNSFEELISDGNESLTKAANGFDVLRGNKFSTYASWAIMKNHFRHYAKRKKQFTRYKNGPEGLFNSKTANRVSELQDLLREEDVRTRVGNIFTKLQAEGQLKKRDFLILKARYGFGEFSEKLTLREVGEMLGVTKERIRQLEAKAGEKLAEYILDNKEFWGLLDYLSGETPTRADIKRK